MNCIKCGGLVVKQNPANRGPMDADDYVLRAAPDTLKAAIVADVLTKACSRMFEGCTECGRTAFAYPVDFTAGERGKYTDRLVLAKEVATRTRYQAFKEAEDIARMLANKYEDRVQEMHKADRPWSEHAAKAGIEAMDEFVTELRKLSGFLEGLAEQAS